MESGAKEVMCCDFTLPSMLSFVRIWISACRMEIRQCLKYCGEALVLGMPGQG